MSDAHWVERYSNTSVVRQKIEEMRITIEDLEQLQEVSDELEETHREELKNLNETVGQLFECWRVLPYS